MKIATCYHFSEQNFHIPEDCGMIHKKKKLWKGKGKKIKNCIVKAKLKYKTKCREFITNLSNLQKRQENIKAQRINPWHWYKEAYVKTEKYSSKEKYIDKSILLQFWYR